MAVRSTIPRFVLPPPCADEGHFRASPQLIDIDKLIGMYGTFVRSLREAQGLTQQELADVSGVRPSNISAIEHDRRAPSVDTLNRLVVACGFELAAVAGERVIYCELPRAGWFPDDDLPARAAGDPLEERPALLPALSADERALAVMAVLEAADATRR